MNSEEVDLNSVTHDKKTREEEHHPIIIQNGTFSWDDESPVLNNINLRVKTGQLIGVVGTVASGKSSLLSAILGEMNKLNGRVNTHVSPSLYVSTYTILFYHRYVVPFVFL